MQPDSTGRITIPLSKVKIVLLALGGTAFVALALWLWSIADTQGRYNPVVMKTVAILGAAFFAPCAAYAGFKLLDSGAGVTLDPDGITDNSTGLAVGFVPWKEVVGLTVSVAGGQKFLAVLVANPEKYVRGGSALRRKLIAYSLRRYGSPINLSSNALKADFEELTEVVREYHDRYGATSEAP